MEIPYDPTLHQPQYTKVFDLEAASSNPSFRRFRERVCELLNAGSHQ
jgi:hypothetical protein